MAEQRIESYEYDKQLFNQAKYGRILHLVSFDGALRVDVGVKEYAGVYGLAVKRPEQKRFKKCYIQPVDYIVNYLAQFEPVTT